MLQMMLILHEMLTTSKHQDYLREMEEYRRVLAAERAGRIGRRPRSRTLAKIRRLLAGVGIVRIRAPRRVAADVARPESRDAGGKQSGRERRIA